MNSFILNSLIVFLTSLSSVRSSSSVTMLSDSRNIKCCESPRKDINIYCYEGRSKNIIHTWETVLVHVSINPDEYQRFDGANPDEVLTMYHEHSTAWVLNSFLTRKRVLKLNPFNTTCIGIVTMKNYDVNLQRIRLDYWRLLLCLSGLMLFVCAPKLSSNPLFYYITGISVGTCASVLILVYFLSRMLPRKPFMYAFLVSGWTVGLYLAQVMWDNLKTVIVNYKTYLFYYVFFTGLLSFFVCYRMGPVTDARSMNLIKWTLQTVSLALIFCSTDHQEAGMALVLLVLVVNNLPFQYLLRASYKMISWWRPPRPKLITEEEYHQQGTVETKKALDSLRTHCSSPECNQWRTVLKLKDPLRFAKFVEGASHLDDAEVLAFKTDTSGLEDSDEEDRLITDDSSSD